MKLNRAIELLNQADAVILTGGIDMLVYPEIKDEDPFLVLTWTDDGRDYKYAFTKGGNEEVMAVGNRLYLSDECGYKCEFILLQNMPISETP